MARNTKRYEIICQNQKQKDDIMCLMNLVREDNKPNGELLLQILKEIAIKKNHFGLFREVDEYLALQEYKERMK